MISQLLSDEFDKEEFTEEEIGIIRRMLPVQYANSAKNLTRGEFFRRLWASDMKTAKKIAAPLRRMMYKNALSKRSPEKTVKKSLSIRKICDGPLE